MDFGLGLVLSFTDNATAGIQNAVNTLNQLTNTAQNAAGQLNDLAGLTAFSAIATRVGDSMTSMGQSIISTFGQIIGKVNETGTTLMYAENQLGKLYENSGRTGKDVLGDIAEYAKTSIFEFEDLIPVVTMLKANGIEAFDSIASSTGNANQTLMDYAADLAAFNPQMRNAYGTGIRAAMGALSEYIAEGNAMSLKRGASLDITSILGEDKGATIEERSRQVADLLEKLNMVGMTAQLAQSPMTKLSNMQDTLFQFIGMVSESGVYESYTRIIDIFSSFVTSLSDERLQSIAKTVGEALGALMKPVEKLAQWLVKVADGLLKFIEANPGLAKFATIATAVAGALLIVVGVALKVAGSLGYLTLMLKSLNSSFTSIGAVVKFGAKKILTSILPLALTIGLLVFAWKRDLFGLRSTVTGFTQGVANSFKTAKDAVSGDVNHMKEVLGGLDRNNFFDNLTIGITKFMVLFQALREGWDDFTLSEDTFLKAKELGILPLIEAIFDLKYRFGFFKEGFIAGWEEISNAVKGFFSGIANAVKGTFLETILDKLTSFFQKLSDNDPESWRKAGKIFSYISAGLLGIWGAVKLFKGVSKLFGAGRSVGGVISNVLGIGKGDKNSVLSNTSGGFLSNPAKVAKTMGSIAIILGGATVLITALGAFTSIPMFKQFMGQGFQDIIKLFENLIPLIGSIGALGLLAKAFEALKISPKTAALGIANFAILLGGMEVLITAMGALNSIPMFDDFLNTGVSVTNQLFNVLRNMFDIEVLGSIALIAAFGNVPVATAAKGLANLAIILGGLDVLITAMGALNSIPGFDMFLNSGIEVINKVFGVLRSMFDPAILVTIGLISAFGLVPVAVTALGLANLAIVLGGITAVISAFAALSQIDGFDDFISRGGDTLANLFGQLGKIVGTAIAEFGSAVTSTLPDIGTNIAGFAENVKPFFEMTQDTDFSSVSEFMGALSEMFLVLTGEKIVSFFTGGVDLPAVGTQLAEFATAAEPFFTSVSTMGDSAFENASKMFAALDGLNNYSFKDGGIAQLFTGSLNIGDVGTQLAEFATGAEPFFTAVSGLPENSFTNADKMFGALEGLNNYSFKSGGLAQLFTGTLDLTSIGQQLSDYATNGKAFFDTVATMPETGFDNATKMFAALEGLNNYSFKTGGLAQLFTGTLDLSSIGQQLSDYASNASTFFTTVSGMDETGFTNATKMFDALSGLDMYEFKSGGLAQLFTGSLDLSSIGTQLSDFATNSSTFFTTAGSVDATSIESAIKIFDALGGLNAYEFKSGGLAQLFTGSFDISSVGSQLSDFATNGKTFFDTAATITDDGISRGQAMLSILATVGDSQGVIDAMGASWGSLSSVGTDLGSFATNSADFWTAASSFEETTATKGASMLGIMSSLESIPEGTKKIKDVGSHLSDFATKAEGFFTMVSGLDDATIARGSSMATMISDITTTLQSVGNNNIDLSSVTTALTDFTTTLTQFATDVSAMPDFSKLTEFTTSLSGFGSAVSTASSNVTSGMTSITTSVTGLESAISTKFGTMSTTVTTKMATIKTSITTAMSGISTVMTTKWTTIGTTVTTKMTAMNTSVTTGFTTMKTTITTATSSMRSSVTTNFTAIKTTISSMMTSAQSSVTSSLNAMKTAFSNTRFSIPQHHISVPHFSVSGSLNATSNPPSVPSFSVSWYGKGGIFDSPSIIGVGEQGREAVMPLDRNTSWIGMLAQQIGSEIESVNLKPISTQPLTRGYDDNNRYIASGGNNTNTYEGDTDNSIVFEAGAIQLNVQNASDEEALRMAKKIMALIKRQDELDRMTSYA